MRIPDSVGLRDSNEIVTMMPQIEYAAVAIVIGKDSLILEKRSLTQKDPWSGQFSLPGGHHSKEDVILKETAIRETLEETGVNLNYGAKYLGHFGPFVPRNRNNLEVYAYAFEIPTRLPLVPSGESEYIRWVELSELQMTEGEYGREFRIRDGVVWGLTARIIERFLELCEISK